MRNAEMKRLGRYLRERANDMGLRDWSFDLKEDPLDDSEGAYAKVEPIDGQKLATVHVCKEFRDLASDVQRMAIVHELVHCHMASVQYFARTDLSEILGSAGMLMQKGLERDIEYAVDGIAVAWAEQFPMIEWAP